MELRKQINRQRVKHIISSYQLNGDETIAFDEVLERLLQTYPSALIELALVETLVDHWLNVPLLRGSAFLERVHTLLQRWEGQAIVSAIAPEQFQQITGLDPTPIFGISGMPSSSPPTRSLGT